MNGPSWRTHSCVPRRVSTRRLLIKGRAAMLPALFLFAAQFLPAQPAARPAKSAQANQLMTAGRFEEAIPLYQQLVKAASGNPGLLLNLGLAQHMAGHEREAIPTLEAVLKTQPNSLPALISLGSARLALNQPNEAIAPLRRALNEKPADHETRGLLASALLGAKRLDEAGEEYRKLTDAISADPPAVYGLGMTCRSSPNRIADPHRPTSSIGV